MCDAMRRPHIFNEDFGEYGDRRPKKFGFLIRPTLQEFNDFILLFDKMLSDNINKDFFQNEVTYETQVERDDGGIQINPKGTLRMSLAKNQRIRIAAILFRYLPSTPSGTPDPQSPHPVSQALSNQTP